MAIYPNLPKYLFDITDPQKVYDTILSWANQLNQQLELRDNQVDKTPATKVYSVLTVTDIGRPSSGDIAFSLDEGKFKGYVSGTGWVNFN